MSRASPRLRPLLRLRCSQWRGPIVRRFRQRCSLSRSAPPSCYLVPSETYCGPASACVVRPQIGRCGGAALSGLLAKASCLGTLRPGQSKKTRGLFRRGLFGFAALDGLRPLPREFAPRRARAEDRLRLLLRAFVRARDDESTRRLRDQQSSVVTIAHRLCPRQPWALQAAGFDALVDEVGAHGLRTRLGQPQVVVVVAALVGVTLDFDLQ